MYHRRQQGLRKLLRAVNERKRAKSAGISAAVRHTQILQTALYIRGDRGDKLLGDSDVAELSVHYKAAGYHQSEGELHTVAELFLFLKLTIQRVKIDQRFSAERKSLSTAVLRYYRRGKGSRAGKRREPRSHRRDDRNISGSHTMHSDTSSLTYQTGAEARLCLYVRSSATGAAQSFPARPSVKIHAGL